MAAALPQASLAQASLPLHIPLIQGGISYRGSPPSLPQASLAQASLLLHNPLIRGGISCRGSPPALTPLTRGGISCRGSPPGWGLARLLGTCTVFCRAGRIEDPTCINSTDREAMEAFYQKRNADFLEGMAELSDMFVEPSNLSKTLKLIRQGGVRELVIFDSDEELAAATNGDRLEGQEETIILETEKDRFVPMDFTNNEELYTLLDESS